MKDALCTSYVLGAGETFQVLQVAKQVRFYCIPDKVQNGQAIDVVKLYLRDHPETRQYSAPTLIMLALKEKFPCN
jgi:Ssp1 endopeptidase immunity protein Rap1a